MDKDLDKTNDASQRKSVGIAFTYKGKILLESHPNDKEFKGHLSIPKGRQEKGESDIQTVIREIKEEINIDVPVNWIQDKPSYSVTNEDGWVVVYFIVPIESLSQLNMETEDILPDNYQLEEVYWAGFMDYEDAWENMYPYQRAILTKIGYSPEKDIETKGKWVIFALDSDGKEHVHHYDGDVPREGLEVRVYKDFKKKGITIVNTEPPKFIKAKEGDPNSVESLVVLFERETGEKFDWDSDPLFSFEEGSKKIKFAEFKSISGKTYEWDENHETFIETSSFNIGGELGKLTPTKKREALARYAEMLIGQGYDISWLFGYPLSHWDYDAIKTATIELEKLNEVDPSDSFYKDYGDGGSPSDDYSDKDVEEGTDIEMEHEQTIKELSKGDLSVEEGAKKIAIDHLNERGDYYDVVKRENLEDGGVIEGQLHSECEEEHGCGVKFTVGSTEKMIEAERDEAVLVSSAFGVNLMCPTGGCEYTIKGTCSQIASAINVLGGGKNFDKGAVVTTTDGSPVEVPEMKTEASDTDVESHLESGTIIINRRSMADPKEYTFTGTLKQIASAINSNNGNGVVIEEGATEE